MYWSNGNYEAFARPEKPQDVDKKSAYLIGAGIASLAAAAFLIRDGQMKPENINIFEELELPGGSLDGILNPDKGFIIRVGQEMENHFECLWDLFRSIPSLELENASVLDEIYWLNKKDPNFSKCRLIYNRGKNNNDGKFKLSRKASKEIIDFFLIKEENLSNKKIDEVFSNDFFESNFWWYWSSMFAFEKWHSAMEMHRYLLRFIHHFDGLADLSSIKFTKYNQYESLVLPLVKYLKTAGVNFHFQNTVKNVLVEESKEGKKTATKIILEKKYEKQEITITKNDLVFITNGSITESTTYGNHEMPAPITYQLGSSWKLWKNLAEQSEEFGHPEKFCDNLPRDSWFISATLTTLNDKITPYIQKISKRDPYAKKIVTGGIVTVTDSNWNLSYTINRQPHFKNQPDEQLVIWMYGLISNKHGNYIKKNITECSGMEIAQEWMYHLGVPETEIIALAKDSCNVIPVYMPYITSYFMPRSTQDRPLVVPKGSQNLAFIGNFAETKADTVFTTEYSVRTAMEAVYTLLNIDRGVPEVFASAYDLRTIIYSAHVLLDYQKISEINLPWILKIFKRIILRRIKNTAIEEMLQKGNLL